MEKIKNQMRDRKKQKIIKKFELGDLILLISRTGQKYCTKLDFLKFHCSFGVIELGGLIKKEPGHRFITNLGKEVIVLFPSLGDETKTIKHESQIIYKKDAALIAFLVSAVSGSTIYEAGTGSGALTSILAKFVGSTGRIITHERRKEALNIAKQNIQKQGLKNVQFHYVDVQTGFCPGNADGLILDLGDPYKVIPQATKVLIPGKKIVVFLPTYNQIAPTIKSLEENHFIEINGSEFLERKLDLKKNAIRPKTRMIGHTGFILSARFVGVMKNEE